MPETLEPVEIAIRADGARLHGDLVVPDGAVGVVVFAHGSGSGRSSPRNRHVAGVLNGSRIATLLLDLLTEAEGDDSDLRFDVDLLSRRLLAAIDHLATVASTETLPVGCFGASTGAAAALVAATERPDHVRAVVSRGGRPDLAHAALGRVGQPTLLIVGGADEAVVAMNRAALEEIPASEKALAVIPGATHLFEEPGALDEVARLASAWFARHLAASSIVASDHAANDTWR